MSKLVKRVLRKPTYFEELGASTVIAGAAAYAISNINLLPNIKEALYNARHAGQTSIEMFVGPEGMRSARNLEEAIARVEGASGDNAKASSVLNGYLVARTDLVKGLVNTYRINETFGREVGRLKIQLEGALKAGFDIGNQIKDGVDGVTGSGFMKKVDDLIIGLYGQDPIQAREKSTRVKEFYEHARKFYDAREKSEHIVSEFCNYLDKVRTESEVQNLRFNELFPDIIKQVREGYETEDIILKQRIERDFSQSRVSESARGIKNFRSEVDKNYESVRQEIPIQAYSELNWVDFVAQPLPLGIAAALLGYASGKLFLPNFVFNPITRALALPITGPLSLSRFGLRKGIDKLKKLRGKAK